MNTFICPAPSTWAQIASDLIRFWKVELNNVGPSPPYLVLSGWNYSDDYNKMNTWLNCIRWAEERDCSHLIPEIPENYWYQKDILYGFRSLEENFINNKKFDKVSKKLTQEERNLQFNAKPSKKLTKEERDHQFNLLKAKWAESFGDEYFPKRLSGKKCKRLIVKSSKWKTHPQRNSHLKPITITNVNNLLEGHTIYEIDFKK